MGFTTIPKAYRCGVSLLSALREKEEVVRLFSGEISGKTNNLKGLQEESRSEILTEYIRLLIPAQVTLIRDSIGELVGDWIRSPEIFDHNGTRVLLDLVAEIPVLSGKRQFKNCFNVRGELRCIPSIYLYDILAVLAKLAKKEDQVFWENLHRHPKVSKTALAVSFRINCMK